MSKAANTNQYEAMFLFPVSASADIDKSLSTIRGIIERHGGEILVLKKWDERKLAYELKGQKRGVYVICYFNATGSAVTPIERDVTLSEDILRVLITRAEHLNKEEMAAVEPQPIQPKEERPSWERDDRPRGGYDRPRRDDRPREERGGRREESPEPAAKD